MNMDNNNGVVLEAGFVSLAEINSNKDILSNRGKGFPMYQSRGIGERYATFGYVLTPSENHYYTTFLGG